MTNVLIIDSAATGEASVTRRLTGELEAILRGRGPVRIVHRDVGTHTDPASHRRDHARDPRRRGRDRRRPRRHRPVRRADRRAEGGRPGRHRRADVQFRNALDAQGLVRPCPSRRDHLPLLGGRARGAAQGQEDDRHREPRRPLQQRPVGGDGQPGAASAHPARLHGPGRRRPSSGSRSSPSGPSRRPPRSPRRSRSCAASPPKNCRWRPDCSSQPRRSVEGSVRSQHPSTLGGPPPRGGRQGHHIRTEGEPT